MGDFLILCGIVLVGSVIAMLVATWLLQKLGFLPSKDGDKT